MRRWIVASTDPAIIRENHYDPGGLVRVYFCGNDFDREVVQVTAAGSGDVGKLQCWSSSSSKATMMDADEAAALALIYDQHHASVHEIRLVVHDGGTHA